MAEVCRGEHIAVGTEILLGQILNSHARTVSQEFVNHGFFMYHHQAVGDNLERIVDVLNEASSRSNVVVITGGIGPTEDDLSRDALARHLELPLELDESAMADLELFFRRRNRPMPAENRKQAMRIRGADMLPNPNGTAPGQYIANNGIHYFLLPGPPLEMKPMLQLEVIPRLQRIFPSSQVLVSRVLHFCGIGESAVDEQITDLLQGANPTVAPLAGEGEMLLRITARGASQKDAEDLIVPVEEALRRQFSKYIYGVNDESLPSVALRLLTECKSTLAVAESCTGGLIQSMITAIPGSSAAFMGGVVSYSNEIKQRILGVSEGTLSQYGAVSEQTAREMAEGVRDRLQTTYGIATTGIAGPEGGSAEKPVGLVYVAVAGKDGSEIHRLVLSGSREQIRIRAAKQVLWRLIRRVRQDQQQNV